MFGFQLKFPSCRRDLISTSPISLVWCFHFQLGLLSVKLVHLCFPLGRGFQATKKRFHLGQNGYNGRFPDIITGTASEKKWSARSSRLLAFFWFKLKALYLPLGFGCAENELWQCGHRLFSLFKTGSLASKKSSLYCHPTLLGIGTRGLQKGALLHP